MTISLKANAAGTQGEIQLNGSTVETLTATNAQFVGQVESKATGFKFPDGTVQAAAAFTKGETNSRSWKTRTIANAVTYTNNTTQEMQIIITTGAPSGSSITGLNVDGIQICNTTSTFNVNNGQLNGVVRGAGTFSVGDLSGPVPAYTLAAFMAGPISGIIP